MILSNVEIHKALDEGRLIIKPEPSPRSPAEGKNCPYATTAVDLRAAVVEAVDAVEAQVEEEAVMVMEEQA